MEELLLGADNLIKLWELDLNLIHIYKNNSDNVNVLCILKDGGFCSGGSDGVVNIYH